MKKILACLIPGLMITYAFAGSPDIVAVAPVANFDGLYAGLGGGLTIAETTTNSSALVTSAPPVVFFLNSLTNNANQFSNNGIGQIFLGYGKNFNPFYLGAELYGSFNDGLTASVTNTSTAIGPPATLSNTIRARLNSGEFGVDLRPGIVWGDHTLFYGRIGAAFNRISLNSNTTASQIENPLTTQISNLVYNTNKNQTGLRLGLGIEEMISTHFSIRGDYIFTDYGKVSGNGSATFTPTLFSTNILNNSSSVKLSTNTVLVSASYYFGNLI